MNDLEPKWHWLEPGEVIRTGDQLFHDHDLDEFTVKKVAEGLIFPTDGGCIPEVSVRVPRTWKIRRQRPPIRMASVSQ